MSPQIQYLAFRFRMLSAGHHFRHCDPISSKEVCFNCSKFLSSAEDFLRGRVSQQENEKLALSLWCCEIGKQRRRTAMPSMRRIILAWAARWASSSSQGSRCPRFRACRRPHRTKRSSATRSWLSSRALRPVPTLPFSCPPLCPRIALMIACVCTLGPCLLEADTRVALEQVLGVRRQRRCCALASIMSLEQCATSTKWRPSPS